MKRMLVAASILFASSSAFAADHLVKIGEVMISNQGSTTSQFIEMEDPGESFPSPPYSFEYYDAGGNSIGSTALTVPSGTTRLVAATPTAATQLGFTPQATLTVTLPANGQACFKRGVNVRIYCLAWGTVTTTVLSTGGTNATGPTPPDGMSVQLVSGSYALGAPTPGAANAAPVPDAPPAVDAGIDAPPAMPDASASIDAPAGGNPQNPSDDDDGCSVGASASWFVLVGLAGLVLLRRRPRT